MTTLLIISLYLIVSLGIGFYGYWMRSENPEDYFLAGRGVGPLVLFFTLVATNFSAFFFLGFAGAGYRIGYGYYGIMSFGTALVSLTFFLMGRKIWAIGKREGFITPPEMMGGLMRSRSLKLIYLIVMVLFTIPYLAIQPVGAGILLSELTGWKIQYFQGSVILSVVIVLYVFLGGMRSVALTDVVQGLLMFSLMFVAVFLIGGKLGGIQEANHQVQSKIPGLFTHAGRDGYFTPQKWFSYMILWAIAVPMFPQMFMRFFIGRDSSALRASARIYPLVTAFLFLCPIVIGVMGHIPFPDLAGQEADKILPMMLMRFTPEWLSALVMIGALAAFMSTMDSQLLALSSMLTRDFYVEFLNKNAAHKTQVRIGKILVIGLCGLGLAIAFRPPEAIFEIVTQAFTGLSVLFPTTFAVLYWKRASASACVVSILSGEILLAGFYFGWIPDSWTFGFLRLVPILIISSLVLVTLSFLGGKSLHCIQNELSA